MGPRPPLISVEDRRELWHQISKSKHPKLLIPWERVKAHKRSEFLNGLSRWREICRCKRLARAQAELGQKRAELMKVAQRQEEERDYLRRLKEQEERDDGLAEIFGKKLAIMVRVQDEGKGGQDERT